MDPSKHFQFFIVCRLQADRQTVDTRATICFQLRGGNRSGIAFDTDFRIFPECRMKVFPAFNSLQMLAHRILIPYADMVNVSLTGRPWKGLDSAVIRQCSIIGVLTDHKKGPKEIADRLLEYGYDNYTMAVGENLGNEKSELVSSLSLEEASSKTFSNPNCVILIKRDSRKRYFGIPEAEFAHLEGRKNMITKMPVRLLSLSLLELYDKHTL